MLEGSDGRYYFQAGAIIVPGTYIYGRTPSLLQIQKLTNTIASIPMTLGFWRMVDKLGLPLEEIHTNGAVPQCERLFTFASDHSYPSHSIIHSFNLNQ